VSSEPGAGQSALFGRNPRFEAWRAELRRAHSRGTNSFGSFPGADAQQQPSVSREGLAGVASPAPSLSSDGRLDAGPNSIFDAPIVDDDLSCLPIRQFALIKTILADLPSNAPRHLSVALKNYGDELKARGVQPILGLLKDMAAIIEAAAGAEDARREWLEEGVHKAFERFEVNHDLFVRHFPLDPQREELYSKIYVDEGAVTGDALSRPFEDVARATIKANQAHLTTDDFLKIVDKMAEFAKVVSTQPAAFVVNHSVRGSEPSRPASEPQASANGVRKVSLKKRILLSGFGFIERCYNLLGSTASLLSPDGMSLLNAFKRALSSLSKLIGL
jgi:hypothetical protein